MIQKRLIGGALTLIGAGLLTFADRAWNKVNEAKTWTESFTNFFQNTVWGNITGKAVSSEVSKHDSTIQACFIIGLILVGIGVFMMIHFRKKSWF